MIDIVEQLQKRGVGFLSINDGCIHITTASGEICATLKTSQASYFRYLGLYENEEIVEKSRLSGLIFPFREQTPNYASGEVVAEAGGNRKIIKHRVVSG